MRYQDQQTDGDQPDVVKSEPVPVPPPGDAAYPEHDRDQEPNDRRADEPEADQALVDRGTFEDPVVADGRTDEARPDDEIQVDEQARADQARDEDIARDDDAVGREQDGHPARVESVHDDSGFGQGQTDTEPPLTDEGTSTGLDRPYADAEPDQPGVDADRDHSVDRAEAERGDVVEPAPQPTAFGAATVGGATAAAAMAGAGRPEPRDVRDEETVRAGNGSVDDQVAGGRATPADRYAEAGPTDTEADVTPVAADAGAEGQPVGELAPAGELMPGDVPAEAVPTLLAADTSQGLRDRWREVQLGFVDDPRAAARDAQQLVDDALEALSAALAEQKNRLGGWGTGDAGDTENLRVVVRRYRDFLDRVLGL